MLQLFDLEDQLHPSKESVRKSEGRELSASHLAQYHTEFSLSTAAVLALWFQISLSKMKEPEEGMFAKRAMMGVNMILDRFLKPDDAATSFTVHDDSGIANIMKLDCKMVSFEAAAGARHGLAHGNSKVGGRGNDVASALRLLIDMSRRPSQNKHAGLAKAAAKAILEVIETCVEVTYGDKMWDEYNALALDSASSEGRAARTPLSVMQIAALEVAHTQNVGTVQSLWASRRVLRSATLRGGQEKPIARKARKRLGICAVKTTSNWMLKTGTQAILQSRQMAENAKIFGIVLDGGQVGRKKGTVYIGYNAMTRKASFGTPQEHSCFEQRMMGYVW